MWVGGGVSKALDVSLKYLIRTCTIQYTRAGKRNVPRVYKGKSLSASGRISCPDEDGVAQNLRYASRLLMQRFVTCSRTRESGLKGISFAATEVKRKNKTLLLYILTMGSWKKINLPWSPNSAK